MAVEYLGTCETCKRPLFARDNPTAYRLRSDKKVEQVHLGGGKTPWTGIRLVCTPCMVFFWGIVAESKDI